MPAGEIPKEIKERLAKDRASGKSPTASETLTEPLPDINLGAGASSEDELPPPVTGEALERLVNENPDLAQNIGEPANQEQADVALVTKYKAIIDQQNGDIRSLKQQLKEAKSSSVSSESRKFRVYLALLEGFAARGDLSSDSLIKEGGSPQQVQQRLESRIQHMANLVEYAYRAIGKLPEKLRF